MNYYIQSTPLVCDFTKEMTEEPNMKERWQASNTDKSRQQKQLFILPWTTQESKELNLPFLFIYFCFYLNHTYKAPSFSQEAASFPIGRVHTEHPKGKCMLCSPMQNMPFHLSCLSLCPLRIQDSGIYSKTTSSQWVFA